jgi:hypothetical protein
MIGRLSSIALLGAAAFLASTPAQAAVQAGVLSCRGAPSVGLIVGSVRRFNCTFRPSDRTQRPQSYTATATRIGIDIGVTAASRLAWAVFAPTQVIRPGDLAGNFAGGSASIALGMGAGANALIGGSNNSFALQPLSVEGQVGLNVALGAAGFTLRYAGR